MAQLRVPSLQHLSRNWTANPLRVKSSLLRLAKHPPTFSYGPLLSATRDLLVLKIPYEQVAEGIRRGIGRPSVRENLLSVLPLIHKHFQEVCPIFVQQVDRRFYSAGRGLMVPFDPPLIYGIDGEIHFPWFSFWRLNPLNGERLSLFVSLVREVLEEDPDLETAVFTILDFSADSSKCPRELKIIDSKEIPRLNRERIAEMLEIFAEGYFLAKAELEGFAEPKEQSPAKEDPHQERFDF